MDLKSTPTLGGKSFESLHDRKGQSSDDRRKVPSGRRSSSTCSKLAYALLI